MDVLKVIPTGAAAPASPNVVDVHLAREDASALHDLLVGWLSCPDNAALVDAAALDGHMALVALAAQLQYRLRHP